MNKRIDQSGLSKIVSEQEKTDLYTTEVFVRQLFKEVEIQLKDSSSAKIDELGTFKIIKSGSSKRILFLGKTKKQDVLTPETASSVRIDTLSTKEDKSLLEKSDQVEKDIFPSIATVVPSIGIQAKKTSSPDIIKQTANLKKKIQPSAAPETKVINNPVTMGKPVVRKREPVLQQTNKRGKFTIKRIISIALIIAILAISGYWIYQQQGMPSRMEMEKNLFSEIENTNKASCSCIIICKSNISLKDLAMIYYGNELFWPYIYKANENIVDHNYSIPAKSIIKIPKLTVDLVSFNNGELNKRAEALSKQIVNQRN